MRMKKVGGETWEGNVGNTSKGTISLIGNAVTPVKEREGVYTEESREEMREKKGDS